jgi:hypothetical protein
LNHVQYHPYLDGELAFILSAISSVKKCLLGTPCDADGYNWPSGIPPTPPEADIQPPWHPFASITHFKQGDLLFWKGEMSAGIIDELMNSLDELYPHEGPPFKNHDHLHDMINNIPLGKTPWQSFMISYSGPQPKNAPSWMDQEYEVVSGYL